MAIAAALEKRRLLRRGEGKRYELGEAGRRWFIAQGIDLAALRPGRHGVARRCLDWTERKPHLAGPLGAQLFACWCERGWLQRDRGASRRVEITRLGRRKLRALLGLKLPQ